MVELAPAKINLALHVLGRRQDGYHELDSVVTFADIADRLELLPSSQTALEIIGPFAASLAADESNLVLRAHALLAKAADEVGRKLPPVRFRLEKNLPVASGIGGGSADAAAALRTLLREFSIELPAARLKQIALQLGADVPVCLAQKTCRMRGIGERLEPLQKLPYKAAVLVNPGLATSTPAVFGRLGLAKGQNHGEPLTPEDAAAWRNDLQQPAIELVPEIGVVLSALSSEAGINLVRMSGSGATCFGIAEDDEAAQRIAHSMARRAPNWWVRPVRFDC